MDFPKEIINIIRKIESAGYMAWAVGGCVRDSLLGRKPKDYDVASSCPPVTVCALFPRCVKTGAAYGTVTVLTPSMPVEVTVLRQESDYGDNRHPENIKHIDDIKTDLSRRDFTINAMAWHPRRGLSDPFDGQTDLNNRIIRAVGDANLRFGEDALRIMRCLRFSSELNFDIHPSTLEAAIRLAPSLSNISVERITGELCRLITGERPELLKTLIDAGGLAHCGLSDLQDASKLALLPPVKEVRLCGLMRLCRSGLPAGQILRGLRLDNKTIHNVCALLDALDRPLPQDAVSLKRAFSLLPPEHWEGHMFLRSVLFNENTSHVLKLAEKIKKQPWNRSMLAVSGNDIKKLKISGRQIGDILSFLLEQVIVNPQLNTKRRLIEIAKEHINGKSGQISEARK